MPTTLATAALLAWMRVCCQDYGVDPALAQAVATVESRAPGGGEMEIRCGPLGKRATYWGPFGIHKDFRKRWDISNPYVNIWVGVRALRGRDTKRVLRRFNRSFNTAYYNEVMRIKRKIERGGAND